VLAVRNRYKAWADLTGISFQLLQERYRANSSTVKRSVVIHIGAQWRSKRYPHVIRLVEQLRALNIDTIVARGPGDSPMTGIYDCLELTGSDLVRCFQGAGAVVANDSGPMHLAAYLGCRTICLGGVCNLAEWLPPAVCAITLPGMPTGYRPMADYMSDRTPLNWMEPEIVVAKVVSLLEASGQNS
jgi:ADP-heptose:LPS heptosyltransferase